MSGEELHGGKNEVTITLSFEAHTEEGWPVDGCWSSQVTAHDGDIGCDLILGYPWLKANRLNVQPWRDALQLHDQPRWVLIGHKEPQDKKKRTAMVVTQPEPTSRPHPGTHDAAKEGTHDPPIQDPPREIEREKEIEEVEEVEEVEDEEPVEEVEEEEAAEEEAEEEEQVLAAVKKMRMCIPGEVDPDGEDITDEELSDDDTLQEITKNILQVQNNEVEIRGVVLSDDEHPDPLAAKLREEILKEYSDSVFRDRVWPNPPARGTHGKAVLRLKAGAMPVVGRVIHLKGERHEALKEMEKECRQDGKLEPGRGPWRAAAFPIKKKSGKWRLVCDYSLTNKQLQPDSYPLPLTEDIVAEQAKCELFSTIDLRDAFHQVALDPESRPITNIQMPGGLWQWTVVPQGINVGPALLQRDIDATCAGVQQHSRPYFDDIIISTKKEQGQSEEEFLRAHVTNVRQTLAALERDKWVSDPKKVKLFMRRVEFVGHVLGGGKRTPAPGKLVAVQKWQLPRNVSSLRALLGLCNYYSGYVRMFAEFAAPLQEKLKLPRELTRAGSKHPLTWTPQEEKAFERLKQALVADLELHHINPAKPFVLRTDASNYAIGAVLEQFPEVNGLPSLADIKPGASVPVAFMSRKLTEGQRQKWDTRDKETYAIVSALDKWAPYILDNEVLILTDHKSLQSWHKEHVAGVGPQGRRARWHAKLNNFQLEVVNVPGEANIVGDALSRWAYPASQGYKDVTWHGTSDDTKEMQQQISKEKEEERSCPVATHPLDTKSNSQSNTITKASDGSTIIKTPNGKEIGIMRLQCKRVPENQPTNVSVTTRSQAKKTTTGKPTNTSPDQHQPPTQPATESDGMSPESTPTATHPGTDQPPKEDEVQEITPPQADPPTTVPSAKTPPPPPTPAQQSSDPSETGKDGEEDIFTINWGPHYEKCPKWQAVWYDTKAGDPWPKGYRVEHKRLLKDGVWCVPTDLTGKVLRAQHAASGHVAGERLMKEAHRHFQFAQEEEAKKLADRMQRICDFCQAVEHPHQPLHLKVTPTPMPPHIMTSVCIDLFIMPEVEFEGQLHNVFAACVDRHSGWVVVTEHHTRGLTAAKVAKAMYGKWWAPHGIPSIITSDRGPHFAGAWWRTMCAEHGVRHAYAQAHHHPANGRAEQVGAQLQKQLRHIHSESGTPWVEALPLAVQRLHDREGQSGLSPYQVLYGRNRPYAGVPYEPPTRAEDAVSFFERQQAVDQQVAQTLNAHHDKKAEQLNRHRRELPTLKVGDKAWYLRPRGRPGEKLETYWLGPCRVAERRSEHSYVVEIQEGRMQEAHRSQLKPYTEGDAELGSPVKLFHFKQARSDPPTGIDEWNVEKVLTHRRNTSGDLEFKVQWEGSAELTWEPLHHFFHRYSQPIVDYFHNKRLKEDVMAHLAKHPAEVTVVWIKAITEPQNAKKKWPLEWEDPPTEWRWEDSHEMVL